FRPTADVSSWLAVIGVLTMATLALTWLAVLLGLISTNPEAAGNAVMPLSFFLPFVSSAFVPLESMPTGVREFAEYQPFTAVIEALRGLLFGGPVGNNVTIALTWCTGLTLVGYLWAKKLYNRS
ncbi:MAG: ABC transporter permease, partial [Actinomycetota bacterium]|nr:ABC transporter permease [Actinomycetota bacterium]